MRFVLTCLLLLTLFGQESPRNRRASLIGKPAPSFAAVGLDGKTYSLDSLRGKPVLLDFFATWCSPCIESMPTVEKLKSEYGPKGLIVLGVNVGESRGTVETFVRAHRISYPVIIDKESGIAAAYSITVYPTFVMIDSDGKIADFQTGFHEAALSGMVTKAGLR
jgi:thiol-disulfide isomerase/thioredoxin